MELSGYTYSCAGGETFDSVALDVYGDEKYAAELLNANPEWCDRFTFLGGEELYLPAISIPDDNADAAEPEKAPWKE